MVHHNCEIWQQLAVTSCNGKRSIPISEFYRLPGDTPHLEIVLEHGELITAVDLPAISPTMRSHYLKVRDRASYEFALVSVAAALDINDGVIADARVALGGFVVTNTNRHGK